MHNRCKLTGRPKGYIRQFGISRIQFLSLIHIFVKAMVPLAEMFGYVTALRTITSGRATSSMVYYHHAQVSNSIAKAVLEEVKGRADLL